MNVGSLFSGIGGIEIGFERAGFNAEWFIEYEPYAKAILKKRFPDAVIYDDIKEVDFKKVPRVEILTGGFPCQDISNAGKRAGIEGSRSSLWKHYLKAISTLQPRIALIENVSALLGRGLDVVLCDLAKIGYDAEWHCVPASAIGANHQRDRIFILAYDNGCGCLERQIEEQSAERREQTFIKSESKSESSSQNVSDSDLQGLQGRQETGNSQSCRENGEQQFMRQSGFWAVKPCVGRVVDGISFRVDRIKCLGNAVVPQVAEVFAEAIKEKIGGIGKQLKKK